MARRAGQLRLAEQSTQQGQRSGQRMEDLAHQVLLDHHGVRFRLVLVCSNDSMSTRGPAADSSYRFPGLMFVALSYFTWICWIAPNNIVVNQLFGYVTFPGLADSYSLTQ